MPEDDKTTDIASIARRAADQYAAQRAALSAITLTNGIVLEAVAIPEEPIRRAVMAIPLPEVPVAKLGDLDIEEENPNDPDYQEALQVAQGQRVDAGYRVATILGTKCKKAPPGFKPGQDKWIEQLEGVGIEVDTSSEFKRYVEWLYLYALADPIDHGIVAQTALQFSFVEVAELSQAILWFWNRNRRDTDDGGGTEGDSDEDGGDISGSDTGMGQPDGGEGDGAGSTDPVDDVEDAAEVGES